jgi:hypothetical protein
LQLKEINQEDEMNMSVQSLFKTDPGAGEGAGRAANTRGLWLVLAAIVIVALVSGCGAKKARNDTITFLKDFNAQCRVMNKEVVVIPIPMSTVAAVATTENFWKEIDKLDEIWKRHPDLKDKKKLGEDIEPALTVSEQLYQEIKKAQADRVAKKSGGKNEWHGLMEQLNKEMEKDAFRK